MRKLISPPAFSLTEILTATAILSVLFTIMFGILQQTSRGWQAANRKVEAAQVARMALEQIATDLESCVVVATNNVPLPIGRTASYALGFVHVDEAASLTGLQETLAPPNDLLFLATPDPASLVQAQADLTEAGYFTIRAGETASTLKRGRYYLVRHWISSDNSGYDLLSNPSAWETTPATFGGTSKRQVFVDNCLRFDVKFIDSAGATNATWPRAGGNGWTGLPRAAEITLCVVDDRTAERLARLAPDGLGGDLANLPDNLDGVSREDVKATLREGMSTFRRRVTFRNGQP